MQLSELSAQQKLACPACGGEAQWNPAKQALVCAYCGTESPYTLKDGGEVVEHDLVAALKAVPDSARGWQDDRRPVRCRHCQAISVFSAVQQGKACDFCGSTALVPFEETGDIIRPETLLPFAVDEPGARDRVRQWYGSRWWAPNNLNQKALTDTLHGVYLPYWTFDAQVSAAYTAEAGTYYKNSQNKREVRWRQVSGRIDHFFDDTLVCGSRGVHPHLVQAVEPFPTTTDRLKPYDPGYLSGWTVERYQLDLVGAAEQGRQRMVSAVRQMCAQDIHADTHRSLQVDARFDGQTFKHVLLPIWLVGYQYGSRDFQVVINGATGQVAGEYPKSWVKIGMALLGVALLGMAWLWLEGR
ncbi:zinc ribbon domain-containing protein [Hydrogenophaga sp. PAMC20947]|uniref:zinc ribbon domain-containing protein n=1 Tax=Hydrogenophaga sp. PAMC20947 TaxID=2565558 RepID=UPI00109E128A|nr:zinc ribbon domain-containing protein [Hydrogenophaga sp. PAMC20947]QCB47178.1 zinc ribbon domain-containing protein [Hydrogenophaga sp. PAMC20947]